MKKWILVYSLLIGLGSVKAQSWDPIRQNDSTPFTEFLAGVKYATIESPRLMVEHALNKNFNVVIAHLLAMQDHLKAMGFQKVVFSEYNPIDRDSLQSLCELVSVKMKYTVQKKNVTHINVRFEGCGEKIFYEFEKAARIPLNDVEAYKKSFSSFLPVKKPAYDAQKTLNISCLGNSGLSEDSIRAYLQNISTDSMEGIYELQKFESPLRIAVVRSGEGYHIVYLEGFSNTVDWPQGEIMGRIRITNRKQFYTADWCAFNKAKFESVPCQSLVCALVFKMGSSEYYFARTFPVE